MNFFAADCWFLFLYYFYPSWSMISQPLRSLLKPIMGLTNLWSTGRKKKNIYMNTLRCSFTTGFTPLACWGREGVLITNSSCAAICFSNPLNWTVLLFSGDVRVSKKKKENMSTLQFLGNVYKMMQKILSISNWC